MHSSITTSVTLLPNSQVTIDVRLPATLVATFRKETLRQLQETVVIDGFRQGHIPEATLIDRVGLAEIWARMAELAFTEHYPTVINDSKQRPIGKPTVTVVTADPDTDVEYRIVTDVFPTVTLGDVVTIAQSKNKEPLVIEVTPEEIDHAIKEIRQMRAHQKMHDEGVEHHDHNHQNIPDDQLPELTDAYVATLGDFKSVDDFTEKLMENMQKEKEASAHEKNRLALIESIMQESTVDIPESMIHFELEKMIEQLSYDLSMQGMSLENYLTHTGTDLDGLKKEWHDQAKKRSTMQLLLETIAEKFSITPEQSAVDAQVAQIMESYKDQSVDESRVIAYVTQMLTNNAVFDWLAAQK
jgi:FKBP-type peptidyl-prolyl cis-trans isomerase (trigger factor)